MFVEWVIQWKNKYLPPSSIISYFMYHLSEYRINNRWLHNCIQVSHSGWVCLPLAFTNHVVPPTFTLCHVLYPKWLSGSYKTRVCLHQLSVLLTAWQDILFSLGILCSYFLDVYVVGKMYVHACSHVYVITHVQRPEINVTNLPWLLSPSFIEVELDTWTEPDDVD